MDRVEIARKGGKARIAAYGNPGTLAGRAKGGRNSITVHTATKTGFKVLRRIKVPTPSRWLAELIGIMAGDGSVGVYQAIMTTNAETDKEHAVYVAALMERLFHITPSVWKRNGENAVKVVLSSKAACDFLVRSGLPRGHKIRKGIRMPLWIRSRPLYRTAFIRGLFDTDGSLYLDARTIKGKTYAYPSMMFSNRSLPLIADFKAGLEAAGLRPTQKTPYAVFLRRGEDIRKYFIVVGSSNPKHLRRLDQAIRRGVRVVE